MQSKEKHKASKRLYINKIREQNRHDYEVLIRKINVDNAKISTHNKLTDENFAKWNSGMYEYDKSVFCNFFHPPVFGARQICGMGLKLSQNHKQVFNTRVKVGFVYKLIMAFMIFGT